MKSAQASSVRKIPYEKPTANDLGPAAPIVGASCANGETFDIDGYCAVLGNSASGGCGLGNDANS